jgi:hypothetical protein
MPHEPKQDLGTALRPTTASIKTYTMGESLYKYLSMKAYPDIQEEDWGMIIVKGCYNRTPTSCISLIEKSDKPFN